MTALNKSKEKSEKVKRMLAITNELKDQGARIQERVCQVIILAARLQDEIKGL